MLGEPGRSEILKSLMQSMANTTTQVMALRKEMSAAMLVLQKATEQHKSATALKQKAAKITLDASQKKADLTVQRLAQRPAKLKENIKGARVLNNTSVLWYRDTKNVSRDFKPIAQAAIIEDIQARKGYRVPLMQSHSAKIRSSLEWVIDPEGTLRNLNNVLSQTVNHWLWWDELEYSARGHDDEAGSEMVGKMEDQLKLEHLLNNDRVQLQRFITSFEKSSAARIHPGKGKKLSTLVDAEVSKRLKALAKVRYTQSHLVLQFYLIAYRLLT